MGDALINYGPITRAGDGQHPIFATMSSLCSLIVLGLIPASHTFLAYINLRDASNKYCIKYIISKFAKKSSLRYQEYNIILVLLYKIVLRSSISYENVAV